MPKVIIHNTVSLDGCYKDFDVDMGLHYMVASEFKPDAHLIGSHTAKSGIEMFSREIPKEEKSDFTKPDKNRALPYWVIVDSKGKLKNLLHVFRRFEFCRDVIILASARTPKTYLKYLASRNYDYIITGDDRADLKRAFEILEDKYGLRTILTDTGRELVCALIDKGLADEISLIISPAIASCGDKLFGLLKSNMRLRLIKERPVDASIHLHYRIT